MRPLITVWVRESVVRSHRVHVRTGVEDVLDAEAARADVFLRVVVVDPAVLDRSLAEIDLCNSVSVAAHFSHVMLVHYRRTVSC
jgi:hypothetical protein